MHKYIALLRGVNVGGKNTIAMPALKAAFEEAGLQGVSTYINSGNIIFSSDNNDITALQEECQKIIRDTFQLDIVTTVIAAVDLLTALEKAPGWWDNDADSKHNAIFVIEPTDPLLVIQSVGEAKPEYEKVDFYGQLIFWTAPLKTFSKTRWARVASAAVYNRITIRNANTVKKLAELVKAD